MKKAGKISNITLIIIVVLILFLGIAINALITGIMINNAGNALTILVSTDKGENATKIDTDKSTNISVYVETGKEKQNVVARAGEIIDVIKTNGVVTAELVSDGDGKQFWLPTGFYYVGGTEKSGIVISDNSADNKKYAGNTNVGKDLLGNQYVWIPVDSRKIVFAQHEYNTKYALDTKWLADDGNGNWPTYYYRNFSDWKNIHYIGNGYEDEMDENIASVEKYGGFYIGRYEAGYEKVVVDTTRYTKDKPIGDTKVPASQYGYAAWNYITQCDASTVCDRLNNLEGYENVRARLIDGYAWDTTVEYISDAVDSVTNSASYGNYKTGSSKSSGILTGYNVDRRVKEGKTGTTCWLDNNIIYRFEAEETIIGSRILKEDSEEDMALLRRLLTEEGTLQSDGIVDTENYQYVLSYELTTGGAESTKIKNIYDIAGNMYEWTSEIGGHNSLEEKNWGENDKTFTVFRSGGFCRNSYNYPVTYRHGDHNVVSKWIGVSFRTVLYL